MKWFSVILIGTAVTGLVASSGCNRASPSGNNPAAPASTSPDSPKSDSKQGTATAESTTKSTAGPLHQPPVLMPLPEFTLTDQEGKEFGTDQLLGRVWVVNFFFTSCRLTCPVQTARMAELQQDLSKNPYWKDVFLASITVDPETDSPQVLKSYAQQAGADAKHWKFLTGPRADIWRLSKEGFRLPVGEDSKNAAMPMLHSPKFVLVDPQGTVRGFYDHASAADQEALRRDLAIALQERVLLHDDLLAPEWMEERRQAQLATVDQFKVFHDFSFADRCRESGIRFRHRVTDDCGRSFKTAHYDHGNGLAVADVDGDGLIDLYFVNQVGGNELWRNLGEGRFENITEKSGLLVPDRIGVTASFADIDNDGDADLYTTTVRGGNLLFENDGKGVFKDITAASGLGYVGHSSAAVFFDYNRDGKLDLFLVNVGIYTTEQVATVTSDAFSGKNSQTYKYYVSNADSFAAHLKPERAEQSILFENQGENRFVDVSERMKLKDKSWSGDATPLDRNQDGWPDLYVLNMQGHDEYYENVQGKEFQKKSREVFPATPWGSMGIKVFDYDNDRDMDILITDMHTDMKKDLSYSREKEKIPKDAFIPSLMATDGNHVWGNAFFRNQGNGTFDEVSDATNTENYWPWGLSVGDVNADGFDDVFITACMNFPFRYGVNSLLLNNGGEKFLDSEFILGVEPRRNSRTSIPWFELDATGRDKDHPMVKAVRSRGSPVTHVVAWGALGSRSSAILDVENDGDLDIVTNDFNSSPLVLLSNLTDKKADLRYLKIRLIGSKSNRDGLGARVTMFVGDRVLTKVHDGKSGYLSQGLYPLYFGLGDAADVDRIEILWPSGTSQTVSGPIHGNTTLDITESAAAAGT